MKLKNSSIIGCLAVLFTIYANAFAYDDQITHRQLTDYAIENSKLNSFLMNNLKLEKGILSSISYNSDETIKYLLMEGSKLEDSPLCRASSHFLNPLKPWNEAGVSDTNENFIGFSIINPYCFVTAPFSSRFTIHKYSDVTWATGYISPTQQGGSKENDRDWNAARTYYRQALTAKDNAEREAYFALTFQALGQVMHLLQDMAVPAHVRNDFTAHLAFQNINGGNPSKWYGNTYEWFVKDPLRNSIITSAMASATTVSPPNNLLTALWDTDRYNGSNPSTSISTSTSPDQGLAEYTNANFFSESTIFAELKDPTDIHYFPRPNKSDTDALEQEIKAAIMEVTAEDGMKDKTNYVTKNNSTFKMAAYSFLGKRVARRIVADGIAPFGYVSEWEYNLDDKVYEDYAKELIPRAVGYSAALLDYFFRGEMETSALEKLDADGNVTELLVNVQNATTNETMKDGYFTLAYTYIKPTGWGPLQGYGATNNIPSGELVSDGSKQLSFVLTNPIPADATEKQYTLVYSGTLGAETGAVVGKVVEVAPDAIAITAPDRFVYALADDGLPTKNFTRLRMQLRNNTETIAMSGGSVTATARYKIHLNHTDDLANEPPDGFERSETFSTVASLPIAVSLDKVNRTELEFDFSSNPIPFGVTDLTLDVAYKQGDAVIAIGTKDLNEPQYVGVWNSHDRFLVDLDLNPSDSVHNWQLMTQDEIMDDPALVRRLDTDNGGLIDEIIDPVEIDVDVSFVGIPEDVAPENSHASYSHIPAGRFGRLAFIADQSPVFAIFRDRYTSSLPDSSASGDYLKYDGIGRYFFPGVTNQQVGETYYYSPIYLSRGIKNHFSYISVGIFPKPANRTEEGMAIKEADWPAPASTTPVPAATLKP